MFHVLLFFFFKQKTAYEMRISDWSSDVCSSDLAFAVADPAPVEAEHRMARRRDALRQRRHAAMRAAADFIAARHDQQPGAGGRIVERRGERRALAIEAQLMPHALPHAALSAAITWAMAASSPGPARRQSGGPGVARREQRG